MRWAGHVAYRMEMKSSYKILVRNPIYRRLGRPRHSWEDCIIIKWILKKLSQRTWTGFM
jgi:hypothetical protein